MQHLAGPGGLSRQHALSLASALWMDIQLQRLVAHREAWGKGISLLVFRQLNAPAPRELNEKTSPGCVGCPGGGFQHLCALL